jgi:tRNA U34 5-methylaminomethyl-2-thiouridine-forming methyltransferase MnmC
MGTFLLLHLLLLHSVACCCYRSVSVVTARAHSFSYVVVAAAAATLDCAVIAAFDSGFNSVNDQCMWSNNSIYAVTTIDHYRTNTTTAADTAAIVDKLQAHAKHSSLQ